MVTITTLNAQKLTEPTAIALGYFDGVHLGHRLVIKSASEAKARGFKTCVFSFTVTNANPTSGKGSLNILSGETKAEQMRLMGVDYFIMPDFAELKDLEPAQFVQLLTERFHAKALYCGGSFRFGRQAAGDVSLLWRLCEAKGVSLTVVPDMLLEGKPVSSSLIRGHLERGEVEQAARLLGRPYSYCFSVEPGRQLGRKLAAPTINQHFEPHMLVPRYGVYAAFVRLDGAIYPAVTNIGVRPTVDDGIAPVSETWIIGYNGDLYGKPVQVNLLRYLRDERKFNSVEELRAAIHEDGETVNRYFDQWLAESVLPDSY